MARLPDLDAVSRIIAETAAEAVLPRFRRLALGDVNEKQGPHDLVTVADTECERLLTHRLAALLPGSLVVGEEAVSADATVLHRLGDSAPVWLIDPVDGTLNFAAGMPLFGVMVALVQGGETRMAWIHDPVHGRTGMAEAGAGTVLDGRRISVSAPSALAAMHGCINVRTGNRERAARMAGAASRLASVLILRCAAQEYLALLEGGLHFAVYNKVMPWDHAAGTLLQAQAGGHVARLDRRRYRPGDPAEGEPLLLAPDETSWEEIRHEVIGETSN